MKIVSNCEIVEKVRRNCLINVNYRDILTERNGGDN